MSKKIFNSAVLSLIIIGGLMTAYLYRSFHFQPSYTTVQAKRGDVLNSVSLTGKVVPQEAADLGFELGGKITSLGFEVGDKVETGQVLATIDDTDIKAQYAEANYGVKSAEAILEEDKSLLLREKNKLKSVKNDDSADRYDKKSQSDQVKAQEALITSQENLVKAAGENAESVKAELDKTVLKAPFSGVISKKDVEVGEIASQGSPIISISTPNDFKVEAFASELDARKIQEGQKAEISLDDHGTQTLEATVTAIDPTETDINGVSNYKVTLLFDAPISDLRSGVVANAKIVLAQDKNVVTLPESSVIEENGKDFVMLVRDGQKEKQEVKTGISGDGLVIEITSGVNEGDAVLAFEK